MELTHWASCKSRSYKQIRSIRTCAYRRFKRTWRIHFILNLKHQKSWMKSAPGGKVNPLEFFSKFHFDGHWHTGLVNRPDSAAPRHNKETLRPIRCVAPSNHPIIQPSNHPTINCFMKEAWSGPCRVRAAVLLVLNYWLLSFTGLWSFCDRLVLWCS